MSARSAGGGPQAAKSLISRPISLGVPKIQGYQGVSAPIVFKKSVEFTFKIHLTAFNVR